LSEALDRSRIMNVAIAEAATVPVLPATPPLLRVAVGFILALLIAFATGFIADYWDPSFRTPSEVEDALGIPVLAAIPLRKPLAIGMVAIKRGDVSA
jgi:capsular polysaccharide biosynthesis protein